ncbi:Hypothetical predicted protein [Mytilus galloprovincialis]|uniref:Uncharacterized protein n=1 Tax=Mytilus galloprovincialis TaxID=29158 RepID=A0A8B6EKI9_MYTGA|nr:Hypothetical predicted protein [Mytilus galloprovincialis]
MASGRTNSNAGVGRPRGWMFWTAYVLGIAAFLFVFIAFASPYWYKSWSRVHSPLANVGLWHICLSGWVKPYDPSMRSYVGCWWIHSTFFEDVYDLIMPRGLVLIVSLVFAEKSRDGSWMPRPWLNYLSFSFGCNVMSGFASAFAGMIMFIKATDIRRKPDKKEPEGIEFDEKVAPSQASGSAYLPPMKSVYPAPQRLPPASYYSGPPRSHVSSRDNAPSISSSGSVFPPPPMPAQPMSGANGSDKKSESFV